MISSTAAANIPLLDGSRSSWARIKRWRLPELDVWRVGALWQRDANGIVSTIGLVIFAKPVAHARGFHAHDRVDIGVERLTIEDCLSDV